MINAETRVIGLSTLNEIVKPFAIADSSSSGLITQDSLDALRNYYKADDHSDFDSEVYENIDPRSRRLGALLHLPFRLALGIHPATIEIGLNHGATIQTYDTFRSIPVVYRHDKDKNRSSIMRTQGALGGAIIESASDQDMRVPVHEAINFSKRHKLLSFRAARTVLNASKLVDIPR